MVNRYLTGHERPSSIDNVTVAAPVSPGQALWNQRETVGALRDRFKALSDAVGRSSDMMLFQWAEIAAFALDFRPDLIIELGRGRGNSTCFFNEVAHRLGGAAACRVVSLCLSDDWFALTLPRLKHVVTPEWFAPSEIKVCNILDYDITTLLEGAQRCFVFWDAHGFEIAEWVLGRLLPHLVDKPHRVVMHDICDARYESPSCAYGETGIWRGTNAEEPSFLIGHIFSRVAQTISIIDFTSRNRLPLHSAAESLHTEIANDSSRVKALKELLGDELFSLQALWFWFTLNEAAQAVEFPRYTLGDEGAKLNTKVPLRVPTSISLGQALWNQRETVAALRERFGVLSAAVGCPKELNLYQWAQFAAFALEFRPDVVIELGRGLGSSTCCFIEVAHQLGGLESCRVVSLCPSDGWFNVTLPKLKQVVPLDWFEPADIKACDILDFDIKSVLEDSRRCLVLWDAPGFEIAQWVIGNLLPQLIGKPHVVLMHAMSDTRFEMPNPEYGDVGIWSGENNGPESFCLGHIFSKTAQAISIVDFSSRNDLTLHSAAESLHSEVANNPERMVTLSALLGNELFSLQAHWYWFTLNELSKSVSFPILKKATSSQPSQNAELLMLAGQTHVGELVTSPGPEGFETLWREVENSAGWRMLNAWRALRDRALPLDSRRRKLYDLLLSPLRDRSPGMH